MAQWTIDPRQIADGSVSADVAAKAFAVFEARVAVQTSRNGWRVPSWTTPGKWYPGILTKAPDRWSYVCRCDSVGWCHHGYGVALTAEADEQTRNPDFTIPIPRPVRRRGRPDRHPLTVVPGGTA